MFASRPPAESETVEFKETWNEDCLKELAALANTRGGGLYLGVRDDGSVTGWTGVSRDADALVNRIVDSLHIHPSGIAVEDWNGVPVLAIQVARAATPVALRGRYFRRVGSTSRELPAEELSRFLLERTGQTWDTLPVEPGFEAFSPQVFEDYKVLARPRLPALAPADTPETILQKLRLTLPDGRSTRAGLLLFGADPQHALPSAQIQIGRFKDAATLLDDRRVTGNLLQQLAEAERLLRDYFFVRYEFPTGTDARTGVAALQRTEVWDFPYGAVREALLNALIHRDYTSTGRIMVRVYDDRMTISNPGGLPEGVTVESLLEEPHASRPRNPLLAQVCYYASLIEQWGSGTLRMRDACRAQGVPEPAFEATAIAFTVTLFKATAGGSPSVGEGLSARQRAALAFVREHGSISNAQYRELAGLKERAAREDLADLVSRGIFERESAGGRSTRYRLFRR